jgi:hypothetical protein
MSLTREQHARAILAGVGATNLKGESGTVPISTPTSYTARVLEETETEVAQPLISEMRPRILSQALDRVAIAKGLGLRAFLEKPCVKYKEPNISYTVSPIKVTNLKWHVYSFYFEGDIVNKISNRSTEGQKGSTTVWRWEDCPALDDSYAWEWIKGSADLVSSWRHKIVEDSTSAIFGNISQSANVLKGKSISVKGHWRSGDLYDFIIQVLNILATGGITTRNGYDITVRYEWKGTQTKTKHVDKRVWLPIEGGLVWIWD